MAVSPLLDILGKLRERYPALSKRITEAEALTRWEKTVGPQIAKHARAVRVQDSTLWVAVDHPAWKSELHYRRRQILEKLNAGTPEGARPLTDLYLMDSRPTPEASGP